MDDRQAESVAGYLREEMDRAHDDAERTREVRTLKAYYEGREDGFRAALGYFEAVRACTSR